MTIPNPGSDEARQLGCICAVLDNNHGRWAPWPATDTEPAGWWINCDCRVHHRPDRVTLAGFSAAHVCEDTP